jgi:hypothetical protein
VFGDVKVWLEEAIFGHRLWPRQNPWLLLLEFLNVAEAQQRESGGLLAAHEPTRLQPYALSYRMGLRNILFNNDDLGEVATLHYNDETLWAHWLKGMEGAEAAPAEGFDYLKGHFSRFRDFADLVALVRQTTLEGENNRRWSSRFIFPFGVHALYSDAIVTGGVPRRDYINFGRTGEILYLMLSRAKRVDELRPKLTALLTPDQPKNRLIGLLNAESDDRPSLQMKGNSFLPYYAHPAFDRLADDWLAVLNLGLPAQDAFSHLAPLASLHVMLYQLETAAIWADKTRPSLVCEIIAPRRELVRQRSIASFNENDALARQALAAYAETVLSESGWPSDQTSGLSDDERLEQARELLRQEFSYSPDGHVDTLEALRSLFEQAAESKLDDNTGQVHLRYGRYVGLVSRRGTNRNRYAPTDEFLKTLVITRVRERAELSKFLADLYTHYGLVLGPEEARIALSPFDFNEGAFGKNRERLEARLGSMGLLKRLSDGCAYVLNPFAQDAFQ